MVHLFRQKEYSSAPSCITPVGFCDWRQGVFLVCIRLNQKLRFQCGVLTQALTIPKQCQLDKLVFLGYMDFEGRLCPKRIFGLIFKNKYNCEAQCQIVFQGRLSCTEEDSLD